MSEHLDKKELAVKKPESGAGTAEVTPQQDVSNLHDSAFFSNTDHPANSGTAGLPEAANIGEQPPSPAAGNSVEPVKPDAAAVPESNTATHNDMNAVPANTSSSANSIARPQNQPGNTKAPNSGSTGNTSGQQNQLPSGSLNAKKPNTVNGANSGSSAGGSSTPYGNAPGNSAGSGTPNAAMNSELPGTGVSGGASNAGAAAGKSVKQAGAAAQAAAKGGGIKGLLSGAGSKVASMLVKLGGKGVLAGVGISVSVATASIIGFVGMNLGNTTESPVITNTNVSEARITLISALYEAGGNPLSVGDAGRAVGAFQFTSGYSVASGGIERIVNHMLSLNNDIYKPLQPFKDSPADSLVGNEIFYSAWAQVADGEREHTRMGANIAELATSGQISKAKLNQFMNDQTSYAIDAYLTSPQLLEGLTAKYGYDFVNAPDAVKAMVFSFSIRGGCYMGSAVGQAFGGVNQNSSDEAVVNAGYAYFRGSQYGASDGSRFTDEEKAVLDMLKQGDSFDPFVKYVSPSGSRVIDWSWRGGSASTGSGSSGSGVNAEAPGTGNGVETTTLSKGTQEVVLNIFYAIETGGQVYGNRDYGNVTGAYANTGNEHAITIGAGQNFGVEAKNLLMAIKQKHPDVFEKYDTAGIEADLNASDWSSYQIDPDSAKAKSISNIISSEEGKKVQDEFLIELVDSYIAHGKEKGVKELDALILYATVCHLGGTGAGDRILEKTDVPYTLDKIRDALKPPTTSDGSAPVDSQMFQSRHDNVYKWLVENKSKLGATASKGESEGGLVMDWAKFDWSNFTGDWGSEAGDILASGWYGAKTLQDEEVAGIGGQAVKNAMGIYEQALAEGWHYCQDHRGGWCAIAGCYASTRPGNHGGIPGYSYDCSSFVHACFSGWSAQGLTVPSTVFCSYNKIVPITNQDGSLKVLTAQSTITWNEFMSHGWILDGIDYNTPRCNIDTTLLQPGDVLFYDGHVDMYIGDGQYITAGGYPITITNLSDSNRLVWGVGRVQ